jgi:DNA-binding IclR family transcriptional regulator
VIAWAVRRNDAEPRWTPEFTKVLRVGSQPVERAIQILDFLSAHPTRGFTLSELSRRLKMSKATAHGVLKTLTDRALVLRSPESAEFRPGPALISMGAVADRVFPAAAYARREAAQLASDWDAECIIVMPAGDELYILGRLGVPGPLTMSYFEGQRYPWAPPTGTIVLAWASDAAVDAWLGRLKEELTDAERQRFRLAIEAARRRGYAFGVHVPYLDELRSLYVRGNLYTPEGREDISRAQAALAHDTNYLPLSDDLPPETELSHVAAPVFGPDGSMVLALALMLGDHYQVKDLPELARAVSRASGRVTAAIDGRQPPVNGRQVPVGAPSPPNLS